MHRSIHRSIARAAAVAMMLVALSAAGVAAHSQTVTPSGNGDGFTKPISNPWAMAHCKAASPLLVAGASGGVVQFNPAQAFDNCEPGTRGQN
jgi:hypothetical protein